MGESELWKVIPGAPQYQVSSAGRVMRLKTGFIVMPSATNQVSLFVGKKNKKSFYLHRLVAQAFIDNQGNRPCVRHKNGDKQNNSVCNLEWCTYSDTMQQAYDIGLKKPTRGPIICTPVGTFAHQREAAKACGISPTALRGRLNSDRFPDWYNKPE